MLGAACLALLLLAAPIAAGAQETVHYTKESTQEFERQLSGGEIVAARFNRKVRSIRLTLKDGRHLLVRYPKHEFPTTEAKLKAKHVSVTVLSTAAANQELREKPKHHKLRYIVGAAVLVVLMIVGAVLFLNRRRQRD
jgi:hypothetical protein